jgi:hypothetical protein
LVEICDFLLLYDEEVFSFLLWHFLLNLPFQIKLIALTFPETLNPVLDIIAVLVAKHKIDNILTNNKKNTFFNIKSKSTQFLSKQFT